MPLVRDQTKQPFSLASPWNTPLGSNATYQDGTDPETALYRNQSAGGHARSFPWIGAHAFGVFRARDTDPVMKWTYKSRPGTAAAGVLNGSPNGGMFHMPTPPNVKFSGNDQWAVIIDPTGRFAIETWKGWCDGRAAAGADYIVQTDLFGTGVSRTPGTSEGIRAFGGSLLGGLVRREELDRSDIPHAIALALSQTQIHPTAIVPPATWTDGGGKNDHSGLIPMGARFAIPPHVQLGSIGLLTAEGRALARAYQNYGGIVTDTATNTNVMAYLELECTDQQANRLQADRMAILSAACMVTNVGSDPTIVGPLPLAGQ